MRKRYGIIDIDEGQILEDNLCTTVNGFSDNTFISTLPIKFTTPIRLPLHS